MQPPGDAPTRPPHDDRRAGVRRRAPVRPAQAPRESTWPRLPHQFRSAVEVPDRSKGYPQTIGRVHLVTLGPAIGSWSGQQKTSSNYNRRTAKHDLENRARPPSYATAPLATSNPTKLSWYSPSPAMPSVMPPYTGWRV